MVGNEAPTLVDERKVSCDGSSERPIAMLGGPNSRVGAVYHPPTLISPEWRFGDEECFNDFIEPAEGGVEEEAVPITEKERRRGFAHPLDEDYCAIVDREFSTEALEAAIEVSTMLMEELGIYQTMARHIQEIQMRLKEPSRGYLEANRHLFPAIANQVDDIYRIGVVPLFTKIGAPSIEKGLQHKRSQSLDIVKSLRGDIRTCEAFAVDTDRIPPVERVEFPPTHTVLKRNPDRSYSEDFRTISDL